MGFMFTVPNSAAWSRTASSLFTKAIAGLKRGDVVKAGSTPIGSAQDIVVAYPGSVPNHIHVDFADYQNRRFQSADQ
jgi:hypothetical protein